MENRMDLAGVARKAMLLGLGAVSLTKEKAEELIQELAQKGEVSQAEARDVVNRMIERGQSEEKEIRHMLKTEFEKFMAEMPTAAKADLEILDKRLAAVESKLDLLLAEKIPQG